MLKALADASSIEAIETEINDTFTQRVDYEARYGFILTMLNAVAYGHAVVYAFFKDQSSIDKAMNLLYQSIDERCGDTIEICKQEANAEGNNEPDANFKTAIKECFTLIMQAWIKSCREDNFLIKAASSNCLNGETFSNFSNKNADDYLKIGRRNTISDANKLMMQELKKTLSNHFKWMKSDSREGVNVSENPVPTFTNALLYRVERSINQGVLPKKNDILDNLIIGHLDTHENQCGLISEDKGVCAFMELEQEETIILNEDDIFFKRI